MKAKYLSELIDTELLSKQDIIEDLLIKKIVYDSRKVDDKSMFIAIKGFSTDGHMFLEEAANGGASVAIVEEENKNIDIPQYVVENSRKTLADVAAKFFSPEIDKMRIVGITGTNGKTTTSFLIRSMLNAAGLSSGLIGTIYYNIGNQLIKAWNTTPESVDLFQMIYDMYLHGQKGCVLEASSHGLSLHRLNNINFEIGVFTNLSQDHLDFHKDFEDYYQAKKSLFLHLKPGGRAVINTDDVYGQRLLSEINAEIIDFSIANKAMITATRWESSLSGVKVDVETPQGEISIMSPLIGKFNVENILAAVASGIAMNFDLKTIKRGIESVSNIPGRLEQVEVGREITFIVDYSHTPDALQKSLRVLGELTDQKLWVVFGCGGDRDKKKRRLMGKISQDFADRVIITSDNPRSESPMAIINEILKGITRKEKIEIEEDRRKAIQMAFKNASRGDIVLVAGKGHEDYQEIKGVKHTFDDRQVIKELAQ